MATVCRSHRRGGCIRVPLLSLLALAASAAATAFGISLLADFCVTDFTRGGV